MKTAMPLSRSVCVDAKFTGDDPLGFTGVGSGVGSGVGAAVGGIVGSPEGLRVGYSRAFPTSAPSTCM